MHTHLIFQVKQCMSFPLRLAQSLSAVSQCQAWNSLGGLSFPPQLEQGFSALVAPLSHLGALKNMMPTLRVSGLNGLGWT